MKKIALIAGIAMLAAGPVIAGGHTGKPENPGIDGQTKAFSSPGFAKSVAAQGGVVADLDAITANQASRLFGNKGKGNGADPDPLGLAPDHDPNGFGGGDDTSR